MVKGIFMKKLFVILIVLSSFIFAKIEKVYVSIEPKSDIKIGDKLKVTLVAIAKKGAKFKFPKIKTIGTYKIIGKPSATVSYSINQKGKKKLPLVKRSLTVTISPTNSFDMPSFLVLINKNKYKSVPFKIKVKSKNLKKDSKSKKNQKTKPPIKKKQIEDKKKDNNTTKKLKPIIKEKQAKLETKAKIAVSKIVAPAEKPEEKVTKKVKLSFTINSNKKSVINGESFIVKIKLVEPLDIANSKLDFIPPKFDGFNFMPLGEGKTIEKSDSLTRIIEYLLTPTKTGNLIIEPAQANLELEATAQEQSPFGFFGTNTQVKKLKTNALNINVKPKPNGVDIVGKFLIKNRVESLTAKANKPFSYIVIIHGIGNLDNYKLPEFKIPNLTIYNEDAKLEHSIENGELKSSYIKKFVFISDKDFTIPAISIKTYDPKSKKFRVLKTKPYFVKVKRATSISGALSGVQNLQKVDKITESIANMYSEKNVSKQKNNQDFLEAQMLLFDKNYYKKKYAKDMYPFSALIGSIILGLILGAGATILFPSLFRISKTKTSSEKLYANYEEALNILYPHTTKNKRVEEMVEKLYEVTSGNSEIKIDEHALSKMIKKILNNKN